VCDLETSRMGAPYIYDISRLRVKDLHSATYIYVVRRLRVNMLQPWRSTYMLQIRKTLKKTLRKTRLGNQIPYLPAQTYSTARASIQMTTAINFQC